MLLIINYTYLPINSFVLCHLTTNVISCVLLDVLYKIRWLVRIIIDFIFEHSLLESHQALASCDHRYFFLI